MADETKKNNGPGLYIVRGHAYLDTQAGVRFEHFAKVGFADGEAHALGEATLTARKMFPETKSWRDVQGFTERISDEKVFEAAKALAPPAPPKGPEPPPDATVYWIDKAEMPKFHSFIHAHSEKHEGSNEGAIGGRFSVTFCSTSVGMIVTLTCACGQKVDLSGDL